MRAPAVALLVVGLAAGLAACGPCAKAATPFRPVFIDVHTHISPEAKEAAFRIWDRAGVAAVLNLSGGAVGAEFRETLAAFGDTKGRMRFACSPDWSLLADPAFAEKNIAALRDSVAAGCAALKIHKSLGLMIPHPQRVPLIDTTDPYTGAPVKALARPTTPEQFLMPDDDLVRPIFAEAGRLGIPVFIHTADPKWFFEPAVPQNERWAELGVHPGWSFADPKFPRFRALLDSFRRLVAALPGTRFVGVHFGNDAEEPAFVREALDAHANLLIDVAARLPEIGRHPRALLDPVFRGHGERVLYGTDFGASTYGLMLGSTDGTQKTEDDAVAYYAAHRRFFETADEMPSPTPVQGTWSIRGVALDRPALAALYCENARRLMPAFANVDCVTGAVRPDPPPAAPPAAP